LHGPALQIGSQFCPSPEDELPLADSLRGGQKRRAAEAAGHDDGLADQVHCQHGRHVQHRRWLQLSHYF